MKNGIIINGVAYKVHKRLVGFTLPNICVDCDLRKKCINANGAICSLFEDKTHEVYFRRIKEEKK